MPTFRPSLAAVLLASALAACSNEPRTAPPAPEAPQPQAPAASPQADAQPAAPAQPAPTTQPGPTDAPSAPGASPAATPATPKTSASKSTPAPVAKGEPAPAKTAPPPASEPAPKTEPAPSAPPKAEPAPAAEAAPAPAASAHAKVGDAKCRMCHRVQHASWAASPHAAKGLDCEGCHGNGGDYWPASVMRDPEKAKAAGLVMPTLASCRRCHADADATRFANVHAHKPK